MDNNSDYILYLQKLLNSHHIPFQTQLDFQNCNTLSQQTQIPTAVPHNKPKLKTNIDEPLTAPLIERYSRQMLLKEISYTGQHKIVSSKVAIIGAGGIGCPLGLYLAAAGVGHIGLFDSDAVQITNLHRQVGHTTERIGVAKTESLKTTMLGINPNINICQHPFITVETVAALEKYDVVIDGSDNPKCRYIVNDYCMKMGKKLLSGACIGWEAQITCYGGKNLCYRCLWGNDQVSLGGCSSLGVVGMIPGIVGLILATEALKMILTGESSLEGKLLTYDGRNSEFKKMSLRKKKPECIACGQVRLSMEAYEYSKYGTCSNPAVPENIPEVSWANFLSCEKERPKILDVRPQSLYNIVHFIDSTNVPLEVLKKIKRDELLELLNITDSNNAIPVSCARGVSSKIAVQYLNSLGVKAFSIIGGLKAYRSEIDLSIPEL